MSTNRVIMRCIESIRYIYVYEICTYVRCTEYIRTVLGIKFYPFPLLCLFLLKIYSFTLSEVPFNHLFFIPFVLHISYDTNHIDFIFYSYLCVKRINITCKTPLIRLLTTEPTVGLHPQTYC